MADVGAGILKALGYAVFLLCQVAGVVMSAITLPGSLVVLASAIAFSAFTHWQRPSWHVLIVLGVLSVISEVLDNVLTMYGVRKYGGSSKSALFAGLGALVGAILGGAIIPVPIVGSLLGAIALGFAAAWWVETRAGKDRNEALRAGWGSILGRAMGATAKVIFTMTMAVIAIVAAFGG